MAQKFPGTVSPALQAKPAGYYSDNKSVYTYLVDNGNDSAINFPGIESRHIGWGIHSMKTTPANIWKFMFSGIQYRYIDEQLKLSTESGVLSYDMSANRITTLWQEFPQLDGKGQTVSVKENRMDTNDVDLLQRHVWTPNMSPIGETHATIMTTLIAGAGNSFYTGRGVVFRAKYSSTDFITALPDSLSYYSRLGINVQNHSYGSGIQNYYGINPRAFDLSANTIPELLHVFSSGNSGSQASGQGVYAGIAGFANITGTMKMAKNILLTGAMDSAGVVPVLSSKGPLFDGRIAPHIVAFAEDGSSGSAALSSGLSVLLQQLHGMKTGLPAASSLIRAVLINSADDIYTQGPDYVSGFGKMNGVEAVRTINDGRFINDELTSSSSKSFTIIVPPNSSGLKLTISWNDPAANSGDIKALVNDLDMELLTPGGSIVYPWSLSIYPHLDSLQKPAERKKDTLNNIEQISVSDPSPGTYTIKVNSSALNTTLQKFSIAYQLKEKNFFKWDFPLTDDVLVAGRRALARWTGTIAGNGVLEMSRNNGPWELLSSNVDLSIGAIHISLDDSAYVLKLRMSVGSSTWESGNTLVSPVLQNNFAYVCDTAILDYWNKHPQANAYRLYRLDYDSMKPILTTADTAASVPRAGSSYFAVSPIINGREAFRGPANDYTKQHVGCYINNFLVDLLIDQTIQLNLSLGSLYMVKKVEFRKLTANNVVIYSIGMPPSTNINYNDRQIDQGLNTYQALVYLENGSVIYSNPESVYYLNSKAHIIYPNPAPRGTDISIVSELPLDETVLIYDSYGKLLKKTIISEKNQKLPTGSLPPGMYHLRLISSETPARRYSFIIR